MEKAKYLPQEIDRMIDEEISRIDAANSRANAAKEQRPASPASPVSPLARFLQRLRASLHGRKCSKPTN